MDAAQKPLVFIHPLSESLKNLMEVFQEKGESEGIEIFEVDSLDEVAQLIPTLGQAIVLVASPKKCAKMLKTNRKAIKLVESKIILLSPKAIPMNTLDKFMKIGLTECIIEPVAPKTLLYKINLILRSIASKEEKGKMNSKLDAKSKKDALSDKEQEVKKLKAQKKSLEESEIHEKKKSEVISEQDLKSKNKKEMFEEESDLGGHYTGAVKKDLAFEDSETDSKIKRKDDDVIETYYKNKKKKKDVEIDFEEPEELKAKKSNDLIDEEEIENIRKSVELDFEELGPDEEKQKKSEEAHSEEKLKNKSIELEMMPDTDEPASEKSEIEDLGGHLEGKIDTSKLFDEEASELRSKATEKELAAEKKKREKKIEINFISEEELKDKKKKHDDGPAQEKKEKKKKVDLVFEDADEQATKNKKAQEKLEDNDKLKKKNAFLEFESEQENDDREAKKVDEYDKYLRSKKAQDDLLLVDIDEDAKKKKSEGEEFSEDEEALRKKKAELIFESDDDDDEKNHDNIESKSEIHKKKKGPELNFDDIEEESLNKKDKDLDNTDDYTKRKKISLELEEAEDYKKEKLANFDDNEDYSRRKSNFEDKINNAPKATRADARADKIETHYSSKKSIKYNDQSWDNLWKKGEKQQDDGPKKKHEEETLNYEKSDLGEQTIDYKKLKQEFETLSFDGIANKRKKYGTESKSKGEVKVFTKTIYNEDGTEEEVEFEEELLLDEEAESSAYFEPAPQGLDIAVKVLNLYMNKEKTIEDIIQYIAAELFQKFKARTSFFIFDSVKGEFTETYAGFIELSASDNSSNQDEVKKLWAQLKEESYNHWLDKKIPSWDDITFQLENNVFIYPFYEGLTNMGFAVCHFEELFMHENAKIVEIILESARGTYLEKLHSDRGTDSNYARKTLKEKEKKSGLFGGLFGKKKAS